MSEQVISSFNRAASQYLKYAHIQVKAAAWLSAFIPENTQGDVLELGAGPGLFTEHLLKHKAHFTITDASPAMVTLGKSRYPNLNWKICDARLPLSQTFNIIFSCSMLQWIDDPFSLLINLSRFLKPNGKLICSLFIEGTLSEWNSISHIPGPITWKSAKQWKELLLTSGFEITKSQIKSETYFLPSALDCLKVLHATGAAPKRLYSPAQLRSLIKSYDTRDRNSRGVPATWVCYQFEAKIRSKHST
jgi:malonyl-CoA O-methyltransferase